MNSSPPPANSSLIIGAGISGLMAARTLTEAGYEIMVLDKGRGVGGRMATRRFGDDRYDHGAQFFTAQDSSFNTFVKEWRRAGILEKWTYGFPSASSGTHGDGYVCYRGVGGMSAIPKYLATGVRVKTGIRVNAIARMPSGWEATAEDGAKYHANSLILTPPLPQSLQLVATGAIDIPEAIRIELEAICYRPCIALLVRLSAPSAIPNPGAMRLSGNLIYWIADNRRKGTSQNEAGDGCLTVHAAPPFSRRHWDTADELVARAMLKEAAPWIGSASVKAWQIHRWRYAEPTRVHPESFVALPGSSPLIFAGDAFAGPGVEGASRSGLAAARYLIERSGGRPTIPIFKDSLI